MVVAIKADSTVCNSFRGLTVRSRDDNAIGGKPFLELRKEPRGRGETTDEPGRFDYTPRKGYLVPDGGDGGFYQRFKQFGDLITVEHAMLGKVVRRT